MEKYDAFLILEFLHESHFFSPSIIVSFLCSCFSKFHDSLSCCEVVFIHSDRYMVHPFKTETHVFNSEKFKIYMFLGSFPFKYPPPPPPLLGLHCRSEDLL